MARERKKIGGNVAELSEGAGFDMTPMIDVTFLLIIFFMCVTELADASKSKLELPLAERAEVDEPIPGRLVINILKDGTVQVQGEDVGEKYLRVILKNEALISVRAGAEFPSRAVLVRADEKTLYGNIQRMMSLCMEYKLWRMAFATKDPNF